MSNKNLNSWYDWLVSHTPEPARNTATAEHTAFKTRMDVLHEEARLPPPVEEGMNSWYNWLVNHVPGTIKRKTSETFWNFKLKVRGLYDNIRKKEPKVRKVKSALRNFAEDHIVEGQKLTDPLTFLNDVKGAVRKIWGERSVKAKLILDCRMIRTVNGEEGEENAHFHSLSETLLPG